MSIASFTISDMAKRKPEAEKKVPVASRIDPRISIKLEQKAQQERRTVSWMIEEILRQYFERK